MRTLTKELIEEVSPEFDVVSIESICDSEQLVISNEGILNYLSGKLKAWTQKKEREKGERLIAEGKIVDASKKLAKQASTLSAKIKRLPANATVTVDISQWMQQFSIDGRVPTNIVSAIERNLSQTVTAVERLKAKAKSNQVTISRMVEGLDVSSDQAFKSAVVDKMSSLSHGFIHSILPGNAGSFMNGLTTSEIDPTKIFKGDDGLSILRAGKQAAESPVYRKVPTAVGNHQVKLSKSDLERLARCLEQYAAIANAEFIRQYGELEETQFNHLTTLYYVEQQELKEERYKSKLNEHKEWLPDLQWISVPTYHILVFMFQLTVQSVVVGIATKQMLVEALGNIDVG